MLPPCLVNDERNDRAWGQSLWGRNRVIIVFLTGEKVLTLLTVNSVNTLITY